jgi:CRP-like cAMP-binding protein
MFIIKSGVADVLKGEEGNQIRLATLERGDIFGEMAILENEPRSESGFSTKRYWDRKASPLQTVLK